MFNFKDVLEKAVTVAKQVGGGLETAGREAIEELLKALIRRLFDGVVEEGLPADWEMDLRDRLPDWAKDLPIEKLDELAAALAGFSRDFYSRKRIVSIRPTSPPRPRSPSAPAPRPPAAHPGGHPHPSTLPRKSLLIRNKVPQSP